METKNSIVKSLEGTFTVKDGLAKMLKGGLIMVFIYFFLKKEKKY